MTQINHLDLGRTVAALDSVVSPVLVATKPFDGTDSAIAIAAWLAERRHAELEAISVIEMGDMGAAVAGLPPMPEEYYRRERDEVAANLRSRLAEHPTTLPTRVEVIEGAPGSSVARAAAARHASTIVIGTGHHGRLGRFLYGERALDVVRSADCSVLVVPPDAQPPIDRAVVAVDFSQASVRAALAAIDAVGESGHVVLVHVERAPRHFDGRAIGIEEECERRTRSMFSRFLDAMPDSARGRLDCLLLRGDPVGALVRYVEEHDVQLLACGRRRHSLVERMLVGSVSTALIRGASSCVLVAPEQPGDDDADSRLFLGETHGSTNPDEWRSLMQAVSRRNAGRSARLVVAPASRGGVETVDRGYQLLDVDYDRRGGRVDISLGDPHTMGSHLSHRITGVRKIETIVDPDGRDSRVQFETLSGRCTLDFAGP